MAIAAVPNASPSSSDEAFVRVFGDIYRQHYQLVYRTAYSVTGSRQDAEDVLQTVFMNLLDHDLPGGLIRSPKAYLYRAAINTALNTVRSRKRYDLVDGVEEIPPPVPANSTGPGDPTRQRLLNAIAKLKPKEVEILILRYEHDYSDAEIATMLGKSRGTIAVTLYRTRARLKKLLRTSGEKQ
jgi:RNA polymerase sigma-70 factor (ECF subfamily)